LAISRGIIAVFWGDEVHLPIDRLRKSIKKFHPELPFELIKLDAREDDPRSLARKAEMFDLSPFDQTLFLDIDTVIMGDLSFGFAKANVHKLALCICEAPWARRYPALFSGDQIEYNTGVIFFSRESKPVFDAWKELAKSHDSSLHFVSDGKPAVMPHNDQGSFALAIEKCGINPFILPLNWNFRPIWHKTFFGPIKVWHDYSDPPRELSELNAYYEQSDSIIQFHSGA